MFCKWCGATIASSDLKCKRCGRDIPALSDCGGFYNLVPKPISKSTADNLPINQTVHIQNRFSIITILALIISIISLVMMLIINIKVDYCINIIEKLEEKVSEIDVCVEETADISESGENFENVETIETAETTEIEKTTESEETTQLEETTAIEETTELTIEKQ